MLSRGTCIKIVLISLLAVTAQHVMRLAVMMGFFSHFHKHHPGPCKKVENIQPGSEDFYTLPDGLTFISSGFRQQHMGPHIDEYLRQHKVKGRIYLFDFKKVDEGVKELKIVSTAKFSVDDFYPHGISVWEDKKAGRHVVFVVNHPHEPPVADRIEKFIFDPDKLELKHHSSYSGEALKVVNSVQPTGENSFYFTNYQYFTGTFGIMIESLLQLPWTDVGYFDGNIYTTVADGMISPNGIAMSLDGRVGDVVAVSNSSFYVSNIFSEHEWGRMVVEMLALLPWSSLLFCEHSLCQEVVTGLMGACGLASAFVGHQQFIYVAVCLGREIRVFRRNQDNSLTLQQIFPVSTVPDNVLVDQETGDLYAGCHPIGHKIMHYLENPNGNQAPSQVLHFKMKEGNITSVQELFYDHGELISGSTSATIYKRKMLIGSIFHNLVTCDVNVPL